jgi:methylenetetrahydrofolate reductase (NADPH)
MKNDGQSKLRQVLTGGGFAITAECGPPRGSDAEIVRRKGELLKDAVDAVNVTDNQTAVVRMSSLAACVHLLGMGIEPVMQMVTRDRNRIALQSDIMGAYSLGIRNLLCLSGDHQSLGSQPESMNVFDIDSVNLVHSVRVMRDEGKDMSGFALVGAPQMFIGAAENPFADPLAYRVVRLAKKIDAGVDFIQTQCVYNLPRFKEWMRMAREEGLTDKVYIMAGITPLKSPGMAKYMRDKVAGIDVPDALIKRMEATPKEARAKEGIRIAQEMIAEIRQIPGVHGIHLMAIEWEHKVPEILEGTGLLPRPVITLPAQDGGPTPPAAQAR